MLGDGAGSFSAATNFAVGAHPISVAVGDFNGDSKQDLAVANYRREHCVDLVARLRADTNTDSYIQRRPTPQHATTTHTPQ